jgi:hypothetical protein
MEPSPHGRHHVERIPRSAQQRFAAGIGELIAGLGFGDCDVVVTIVDRALSHPEPGDDQGTTTREQPEALYAAGEFRRYPFRGILSEIAAEDGVKRQAIRKRALRGDPDTLARIAAKMQERSAKVRRARNAMRRS